MAAPARRPLPAIKTLVLAEKLAFALFIDPERRPLALLENKTEAPSPAAAASLSASAAGPVNPASPIKHSNAVYFVLYPLPK